MKFLKDFLTEKQEFVSKAGAGEDGSDKLVKTYKNATPGQHIEEETGECHLYTYQEVKDLEKFADRLLNKYGVDIEFTRHFGERMSDQRNKPCIKLAELQQMFKRIESSKAEKIRKQKDGEYVIVDLQKDLNLPVVIEYKRGTGFEVRVKTIMRKKNFMTTNQKVTVESFKSHISKL
jgi:hypothetical protein